MSRCRENNAKVSQKLANPNGLSNSVGDNTIFSFSRGFRYCRLLLKVPNYKIGSRENCITYSRPTRVPTPNPISIRIGYN